MLGVARATCQQFVVNDRIDIAALLCADGVHLGETQTSPRPTLAGCSRSKRSFHAPVTNPALVAALDADAVLLSPILESRKGRAPFGARGLELARNELSTRDPRPRLFALGGISASGASECLAAGADGVAVVGAVLRGEAADLVRALGIARD